MKALASKITILIVFITISSQVSMADNKDELFQLDQNRYS